MQCSKDGTPSILPSPEFLQRFANCSNEVLDRRLRQTELAADLLVALSLHHELQHIELRLGQAEAIADNLIFDAFAVIERTRAFLFLGGNMDEYVFARSPGPNNSVALRRVEPFDTASRHHRLLACNQRDHDRTTGVAICTLPHRAGPCAVQQIAAMIPIGGNRQSAPFGRGSKARSMAGSVAANALMASLRVRWWVG